MLSNLLECYIDELHFHSSSWTLKRTLNIWLCICKESFPVSGEETNRNCCVNRDEPRSRLKAELFSGGSEWQWSPQLRAALTTGAVTHDVCTRDDPFGRCMRVNIKCTRRTQARQTAHYKQGFIVQIWEALWWWLWEHRGPLWKLRQEVSSALNMTDADLSCWPPFSPPFFHSLSHTQTNILMPHCALNI